MEFCRPTSILLLTTTGRRPGRPLAVPLHYCEEGGTFYLIPEEGTQSSWYQNLVAQPKVEVQVGRSRFAATATPVDEPREKAHVLRLFAEQSPPLAERYYHIPRHVSDEDLLTLAPAWAIVAVCPRSR